MEARVIEVDVSQPADEVVSLAAEALLAGDPIVFPTETVYGLGIAVHAQTSPTRLFEMKQRPLDMSIPWLIGGPEELVRYGYDIPDFAHELASAFWPGFLTLIVKASCEVPPSFRAQDGSIALRVSAVPLVSALISVGASPLAATSANIHGHPSPTTLSDVDEAIATTSRICLDGGPTRFGNPSSIVSCISGSPRLIREGACSKSSIESVIGGLS